MVHALAGNVIQGVHVCNCLGISVCICCVSSACCVRTEKGTSTRLRKIPSRCSCSRFDPSGDFGQWQTVMEAMVLWQKRRSSGLDSSDRDEVFRDAFPRSALRGQAKATMFPPRSSPARTGKRALRCGNDDITFASGRQPQWLLWLPGRAGGHGSKG